LAIIDPSGLFNGDRLRRCSNAAQLHFPRLFLASDGFGRLEINYARIVGKAYPTFNPIPTETELQAYIEEYVHNSLLFVYEVTGQLWGQWDTRSELLPRYKTAADRRSPFPPEPDFTQWKQSYREHRSGFPKSFGKVSGSFLHGVGVGVGVGNLKTCSSGDERASSLFAENGVPTEPSKGHSMSAAKPFPEKQPAWGPKEKSHAFKEKFWPVWPRKVAKAAAERAWLKHASSPEIASHIVTGVRAQLPQLNADLKYCPYPATWLNDRRYEDDLAEIQASINGAAPDSSLYIPAEADE
jgi:hypothetical protein